MGGMTDRRVGTTVGLGLELEPAPTCPGCGRGDLVPSGAHSDVFRCTACRQLWRLSLGFAQPVDDPAPAVEVFAAP